MRQSLSPRIAGQVEAGLILFDEARRPCDPYPYDGPDWDTYAWDRDIEEARLEHEAWERAIDEDGYGGPSDPPAPVEWDWLVVLRRAHHSYQFPRNATGVELRAQRDEVAGVVDHKIARGLYPSTRAAAEGFIAHGWDEEVIDEAIAAYDVEHAAK